MVNYRTHRIVKLSAGQSGSYNTSGSVETRVWGIMRTTTASGSLILEGGGTIEISDIVSGTPFPCYPVAVSVSAGSVYILS
jgi:hypothetical protein